MYHGSIRIDTRLNSKKFENGINTMSGSLKKLAGIIGVAFGVGIIVNFAKTTVKEAGRAQAALIGLQSIIEGQGRSFTKARSFIDSYIQDGLVPLSNAVTAYKNLAARGYDDAQIQRTLVSLKDASAFGRQASLSMGDAVQSATEGLKNENSILVDNAGVTKNVAKMWEDYADSIGKTAAELSKQEKIQAEVNGILEETKFQVGDAAKYASTYEGSLSRLNANLLTFKQNLGALLQPLFKSLIAGASVVISSLNNIALAIGQVIGMLTGKNPIDSLEASSSNAEDNFNGIADSTADTLDNAKKIKKELAGFDEKNVLSSDKTSSGSSTGSSVSTGMTIDTPTVNDTISPTISAIAESIKNALQPLTKIKLDNLNKSFDNLKRAIEPFTKNIFEGLEWFYWNILIPFTEFTVESIIPTFLDLISGSFNILNPLLEVFVGLGGWLLENFLLPIAEWTGGVIIDVLNGIADCLKTIGDWINDNKKGVETFIIILGSFAAAYGLVTLALNLWNIAVGVWNTIGVIGATVTTAFGAALAFMTSPIGLVVLAIGALIAIGILLWKNWDSIMAFAQKLWIKLKDIFGKIGSFIGGVFKGVINGFINVFNFIINGVNKLIKGLLSPVNALIKGWNGSIGKVTGKISEVTISIPNIPKLARGGIVNRPTQAIIGEAGKEAVLPLQNNTGWMDEFADKLVTRMGITSDGDPVINVYLDGELIQRKFREKSNRKAFEKNEGVVFE